MKSDFIKECGYMSLKELAKRANVSTATVSKAFSGSKDISEKTRRLVFDTAKDMGIFEKYHKERASKIVIAIICPEICSEFYTDIIDNINKSIEKQGAMAVVSISGFDGDRVNELFKYHAYIQKADGVIVLSGAESIVNPDKFPVIAFGSSNDTNEDCITVDMRGAVLSAVKYLSENGHSKIAFIGETNTASTFEEFKAAMNTLGLEIDENLIYNGTERFEDAGVAGMTRMFNSGNIPTAVFAAYDYIAIGAIKCINARGLKVPDDISVIGTDDTYSAAQMNIPLTSIAKSPNGYDRAVEMLMRKINNKYISFKGGEPYKARLVKRKSVKNIKPKKDE